MKTRISALMDGELEDHEIAETLNALRRDEKLREQWRDSQWVGAALRGERWLNVNVSARVMAALDQEPTVMVPVRRPPGWRQPVLALAASAAGVAMVAWLALAPGGHEAPAGSAELIGARQNVAVAKSQSTPRLREYLVAHQAYAPAGAMVGGARNIRTVSAPDEGR